MRMFGLCYLMWKAEETGMCLFGFVLLERSVQKSNILQIFGVTRRMEAFSSLVDSGIRSVRIVAKTWGDWAV